jgi:hypothetical protein
VLKGSYDLLVHPKIYPTTYDISYDLRLKLTTCLTTYEISFNLLRPSTNRSIYYDLRPIRSNTNLRPIVRPTNMSTIYLATYDLSYDLRLKPTVILQPTIYRSISSCNLRCILQPYDLLCYLRSVLKTYDLLNSQRTILKPTIYLKTL